MSETNGASCSAWTTTRPRTTCARSRTSRFKLLAIVPTISGAAVAFLSRGRSAGELLAVGLIGLVATLGVLLYEVRNTQLYDYAVQRAKELEARLGEVSIYGSSGPGGLFTERPGRDIRVFGLALAGHERGLAIVYGAAIAGWSYLVTWGALRALDVGAPRRSAASSAS